MKDYQLYMILLWLALIAAGVEDGILSLFYAVAALAYGIAGGICIFFFRE